jgi:hypothetical protein
MRHCPRCQAPHRSASLRRKSVVHLVTYAKKRAEKIITRRCIGSLQDYDTVHHEGDGVYNSGVDQVRSTVSTADAFRAGLLTNLPGIDVRKVNNQTVYNQLPVTFEQPTNCVCGVAIHIKLPHKRHCAVFFLSRATTVAAFGAGIASQ